jgi:hypothetical protein
MTHLKIGIAGAALVAGIATPIILQQQSNNRLRGEIENLRQQNETLKLSMQNNQSAPPPAGAADSQKLTDEHAELLRLRGQVATFRQINQDLAQAQAEVRRLAAAKSDALAAKLAQNTGQQPSAEQLKPAAEWSNAGIATPSSAYETWNWARAHSDPDALAATLVLDKDARTKAEALLASLPESVRAKYGSAERMMAMMQLNMQPTVTAMRVLSQDQTDPDTTIIHTQWQGADGQLGQNDWTLRRAQEGWRLLIPEGLVDKLGKGLRLAGLTTPESSQP